ncbi:hypothetical protein M1P97_02275 [Parabacteroides sp. GYB001]|uniref:hypothetical protein n=1 Tax=Parabacteroides leei TaxID=2939491 RepID=UPI002017C6AA|nr:hypothetical protein [Parabacteroides leei]MCL3850117.1 hypothetical protein [Parabacteroides leei]
MRSSAARTCKRPYPHSGKPLPHIRQSPHAGTGFYIWAASGTDDSAYHETLVQVEAMEQLTEGFPLAIALSEMGYTRKNGTSYRK